MDVDGVELPSPLLAEAQLIDCGISAVYFSTAQGTAPITLPAHLYVISWGIGASQKLSGGTLQDLRELQDPKILGYLLIFGSYFKPIAYC